MKRQTVFPLNRQWKILVKHFQLCIFARILMMTDIILPLLWKQFLPESFFFFLFQECLNSFKRIKLFALPEPGWALAGRWLEGRAWGSCIKHGEGGEGAYRVCWEEPLVLTAECMDRFVYISIHASKAVYNPLYHDGNSASVFYIQNDWINLSVFWKYWALTQLKVQD